MSIFYVASSCVLIYISLWSRYELKCLRSWLSLKAVLEVRPVGEFIDFLPPPPAVERLDRGLLKALAGLW